jgi:hypothetical protein
MAAIFGGRGEREGGPSHVQASHRKRAATYLDRPSIEEVDDRELIASKLFDFKSNL